MVWRRIKNGLDIDTAINLPKQFSTKKLHKATVQELIEHFNK